MSASASGPSAVVLMNYGGPRTADEVQPFLQNIFSDPALFALPWWGRPLLPLMARVVSRRRAPEAQQIYARIGGGSPLNELTEAQAAALEARLRKGGEDWRVLVAMRYGPPRAAECVERVRKLGARRVILLPLYPQRSIATTDSSVEDFRRALRAQRAEVELGVVWSFHDHPGYLDAVAESVAARYAELPAAQRDETPLVMSAHGLPLRVVAQGDPYPQQIEASVRGVAERLAWRPQPVICYQSRVGPVRWLEPSTDETLRRLAGEGVRSLVLYPISFVSEHSETLYELDQLYGELAAGLGLDYHRVPTLNANPGFIAALASLVEAEAERLEREGAPRG